MVFFIVGYVYKTYCSRVRQSGRNNPECRHNACTTEYTVHCRTENLQQYNLHSTQETYYLSHVSPMKCLQLTPERLYDVIEIRLSGSAFQILAAATGKARLPTVESLKGGTMRRLVPEEWREHRPDTSATRLSGPR